MSDIFNAWLNGYKQIFDYSGRARRRDFAWFLLLQLVFFFVAASVTSILFGNSGIVTETVACVLMMVTILTTLSYNVRRLHDCGQSGWWCFGYLILAGVFIVASLMLRPTEGSNRYGQDPRTATH
ncbi:DUF805 domain-containing protein [Jinshanibacter sp. LJY008]|uniref:DUF805 domain-containing protein n=1 Tax=Limnobaculum eriocheiris TaxID=2897391 RepID=A0A9X1SR86_9GAMM|nr:DUF805 domain-containing protein [Limnobaculum eriocheiris]